MTLTRDESGFRHRQRGRPLLDPPYTRASIARAKRLQEWDRAVAAKDMGIPSHLVTLFHTSGRTVEKH
jgi:hypothetical protein